MKKFEIAGIVLTVPPRYIHTADEIAEAWFRIPYLRRPSHPDLLKALEYELEDFDSEWVEDQIFGETFNVSTDEAEEVLYQMDEMGHSELDAILAAVPALAPFAHGAVRFTLQDWADSILADIREELQAMEYAEYDYRANHWRDE